MNYAFNAALVGFLFLLYSCKPKTSQENQSTNQEKNKFTFYNLRGFGYKFFLPTPDTSKYGITLIEPKEAGYLTAYNPNANFYIVISEEDISLDEKFKEKKEELSTLTVNLEKKDTNFVIYSLKTPEEQNLLTFRFIIVYKSPENITYVIQDGYQASTPQIPSYAISTLDEALQIVSLICEGLKNQPQTT